MVGSREAWAILGLASAFALGGLAAFNLPGVPRSWTIGFVYATPPALVVVWASALRMAGRGRGTASWPWVVAGLAFVAGGAAFDMYATYEHTPDLAREQNPFARALLDSGHSLEFVYAYAIVGQALNVLILGTLWVGLLRAWDDLAASTAKARPFPAFVKAATGGERLTWRAFLFPMKLSELPDADRVVWTMAACLVGGSAFRWYLGLEWYGLVLYSRRVAPTLALLAGLVGYVGALWFASRSIRDPLAEPEQPSSDSDV